MGLFVWFLPLLAGLADAASRGIIKTTKLHRFFLVSGGYLFALPWYIGWLVIQGMPSLEPGFWQTIAIVVPLVTLAVVMMVEAHQISPLSLTMPYLSLTPAFILITQSFFDLDRATGLGALGVVVMTAGIYILNMDGQHNGFLAPFRALAKERGSVLMMAVAFIFGITSQCDLVGIKQANMPFYLLVNHGLIAIVSGLAGLVYFQLGRVKLEEAKIAEAFPRLVCFGSAVAVQAILHVLAFAWIPVVAYVIVGKRAGSIILTVALGLWLGFFSSVKEKHLAETANLRYRLTGILLMIAGMAMIVVEAV